MVTMEVTLEGGKRLNEMWVRFPSRVHKYKSWRGEIP